MSIHRLIDSRRLEQRCSTRKSVKTYILRKMACHGVWPEEMWPAVSLRPSGLSLARGQGDHDDEKLVLEACNHL